MYLRTSSWLMPARSFRSAPAQKAFCPAPVIMTARISLSKRICQTASLMACSSATFKLFMASGRFKVRMAVCSFVSICRTFSVMGSLPVYLLARLTPDIACNNQPLDLRGALADIQKFLVPVKPLHVVFLHKPVAAVDLNRIISNPAHQLRAVYLGHGSHFLIRTALVLEPAGLVHQVPGALQLYGGVRELKGNRLELGDGLAELFSAF